MVQVNFSSPDILMVGAGVMGMLSALELAEAGQRVLMIDQGRAGLEASWAGGGIISPLYPWRYAPPITALATWSQQAFPDLIASLTDSTGIDSELSANGMLVTATDDRARAARRVHEPRAARAAVLLRRRARAGARAPPVEMLRDVPVALAFRPRARVASRLPAAED